MRASDIINNYKVGSADHSWNEEFKWILSNDMFGFFDLCESISKEGIKEPVLLGDDGRVWDGHHRIFAAWVQDDMDVPVERGSGG